MYYSKHKNANYKKIEFQFSAKTLFNGKSTLLVHCLYQMSPLNHKMTSSSFVPPIFLQQKNWQ